MDFDSFMNSRGISKRFLRPFVEKIMSLSMEKDHIGRILDYETASGLTIFEIIKIDIENSVAWKEQRLYSENEVRRAIGRTLSNYIGL